MSPSRARTDTARPASPSSERKPVGRAMSSVQVSGTVFLSKTGALKHSGARVHVVETTPLICSVVRSEYWRMKVWREFVRLKKKLKAAFDENKAPRQVAQNLHVPLRAVNLILQGWPGADELWRHEARGGLVRADRAVEEYWKRVA